MSILFRLFLRVIFPFALICQDAAAVMPWLRQIDPDDKHRELISVSANAIVVVSDSSTYSTASLYQDPQRSTFRLIYPDRTTTLGIEGMYVWQHNCEKESEGHSFLRDFILGHQFHAHLLYLDKIYGKLTGPDNQVFEGKSCLSMTGHNASGAWTIFYEKNLRVLGMKLELKDLPPIIMTCTDWQDIAGIDLPVSIRIDDGQRKFHYTFTSIKLNEGHLDDFRLTSDSLTNEQQLLRLHRAGMDDHFFERYEGLQKARGDSIVIVNRGKVEQLPSSDFDATMSWIVTSRRHSRYDDMIRPIVKVSDDGKLGWVIVQVAAEGQLIGDAEQDPAPFEFVSAWIELYEKLDGDWKMIGNVSNFAN